MPRWSSLLATPRHPGGLVSFVLGLLFLVLRYRYFRKLRLLTFGAPDGAAKRVKGEAEYDFDEYDVVIIGGGAIYCLLYMLF